MKKVLFTATVDSHILQFHLPYLKLFKEKGYEVHVITNGDETIPYCDKKYKVSFERSPFKLNNIKAYFRLRKIINKEQYDIIHTHTPVGSVVTRLAAKKARKKFNTRVIYTAHGFHFFKGASLKNWLIFYPVEKYLAKLTDTIILINKEDFDLAKRKFSKRCKDIQYVEGVGIDENKFNFTMTEKEKDELRKSLGIEKEDFVIIYPAELSKRKRQLWLIDTLSNLMKEKKNIHLLLPGKDSLNGKCQKYVEILGLENKIHFLGYRNDIPKLLAISNLSVSSANQEGLPVNIMEAMYIGLPIVGTDCRGNRDLIIDSKNGYLIELSNKEKFVESVNKIYFGKENKKISKNSKLMIKKYLLNIVEPKMSIIYFGYRKKICHVVSGLLSGGAESFLVNYFSKIDRNKYELYVLYQHKPILKSLKEFETLGFNLKKIPTKKLRPIGNFVYTYLFLKKNNIDIVHTHMTLANFVALFAAKLAGVPVRICHAHSCNNNETNKFQRFFNNKLKSINYKYSTDYLACGIKAGKYMYDNKEFELIHNAIEINKFKFSKTNRSRIRKNYNINNDCILLGHIGSFSNTKNHIFMLDLIEQLPEDKYKIMFIGNGKLFEQMKNIVKERNIEKRVIFTGIVDNPEIYYSAFDLFILPSLWEGLPMVSIEAQANGVNCIISDNVDDSCKINENVDFLPLDIEKWKNYIQSLSVKRVKETKMVNSCYNIEKSVGKLEKIYDKEMF